MANDQKPSFYITTPIYYVNAAPHLGTAYCTMLCDVQARYRRAAGYDVKFLTGMDEHGEKVAEAAANHGFDTPQAWCDSQAPLFKNLWHELEISNDDFIRTTEPRQHHAVQYLWERMKESARWSACRRSPTSSSSLPSRTSCSSSTTSTPTSSSRPSA